MNINVNTQKLWDIPETMLVSLWCRAMESKSKNPILIDKDAEKCIDSIDYDFSKLWNPRMSIVGCAIRAKLIDQEAKEFIAKNPDAVVIQLWTWLDARFDRIGRPKVTHWYDLDLPETIEIRKKLLSESENNTFVSMSLFDNDWIDMVLAYNKPILIIIEWVLMYFSEDEVKWFLQKICEKIPKATFLFDILAYKLVWHAKSHDSVSKTKWNAEYKWSILNTKDLESWHKKLHLWKEYYMSKYDEWKYVFIARMLYKIPAFRRNFDQRVVRLEIY